MENRSPPAAPARVCKHASIFPVLPFSCSAPLDLHYITFFFHSISSFKLIAERPARWKNSSADQTLDALSQTFWLRTCKKNVLTRVLNSVTTYLCKKENVQSRKVDRCQMFLFNSSSPAPGEKCRSVAFLLAFFLFHLLFLPW